MLRSSALRCVRAPATPSCVCRRSFAFSALVLEDAPTKTPTTYATKPSAEELEAARKRRRTEWKRRQRGETFLDNCVVHVRAGRGGDGCVAFHREKFQQYGPPAGGDGGRGGDVYIIATPHLTTLSSVSTRVRGQAGGGGSGTWLNGRNGEPTIIRVPVGTVVRELAPDDPRRSKDEWEAEAESMEGLDLDERRERRRELRFVHFPRYADENERRPEFKDAEAMVYKEEREIRIARRQRTLNPLSLDLDTTTHEIEPDPDAPLGLGKQQPLGVLVARGGKGGVGNPHFHTQAARSPKFATRGYDGQRVSLSLELKLLADVGLVGMPNAGKSTLLRALTGGRARSEVAGYAFTTLNPVVAVVRVAEDGSYEGEHRPLAVRDETRVEQAHEAEMMANSALADVTTRNKISVGTEDGDATVRAGHFFDLAESFRFTIADNPGLVERASENVGLGHSFLRSIERSPALAYIVDLSGEAPWDELRVLRDELEAYKPGMAAKARLVVANKADLLATPDADPEIVEQARAKLTQLEAFVKDEMGLLDVVPVSAKYSQNLRKVITLMKGYVEKARSEADSASS